MPSSCRAILIYRSSMIESFSMPIGLLSEEAQEAINKDFKKCRENNTRKARPELTNKDILRYLLTSSDPYIHSKRYVSRYKTKDLIKEAKQLLILDDSHDSDSELSE